MTVVEPVIISGLEAVSIDREALMSAIDSEDCGALVTFDGRLRSPNNGRQVLALFYEAYEPVAERQLRDIAMRAVSFHGLGGVVVKHRTGAVVEGEPALFVAVTAPHRGEAFRATEWIVDAVKAEVAIWKQEQTTDGNSWIGDEGQPLTSG